LNNRPLNFKILGFNLVSDETGQFDSDDTLTVIANILSDRDADCSVVLTEDPHPFDGN